MTRSTTSNATDAAKETAKDVAQTAKAQASVKAEAAKEEVADRMAEQADNFRDARSAFESNELVSDAAKYLGDNLAYAASAVRDMDLSHVQQDVTDFARRNPVVFFGGAAALGFLAARALKASERAGAVAANPDRHDYPSVPEHQNAYPDQNARRWGYS